ncbi:MAG: hypothetical protein IJV14_10705 [Lachnospiraceae bacterium]|nr:hypothetical protein [Lachnospiraceae bacterium]
MERGRGAPGLGFLYRRVSIHPILLDYWFIVPEFIEGIKQMVENGEEIDDGSVLKLMVKVYSEKEIQKKNGELKEYFNFYKTRRGITQLKKNLGLI